MALGVKVFDVYGEVHLDKDELRQSLRDVPNALGSDADRAGRQLGEKVTKGIAGQVEALSQKVTKARREETKAADAVKLAELRLSEAREKGNQKGSTLLALEQRLTQANLRLADANDASAKAAARHADAQRRLAKDIGDIGKAMGPDAERAGRDVGGKLSQGIHLSIVRNSPLIAAAIGAGLAAGAPLALTAATGLFAGIGIVSAAQSQKVQSAWLGTWQRVKAGAIEDAAVIEPVLVRLADRVGDGFERMRPRLRNIFAEAAPQIEVFADGLLGLVENALPGLDRAVARSMPVTQGFADFLEKTGVGLTGFFDGMSEHAPAAGEAFAAIGDIMAELLPILGKVLGQGAELATMVLPPIADALGIVNKGLDTLGPLLPFVLQGFLAYKAVGGITDILVKFGSTVGGLPAKITGFFDVSGKMAAGMGGIAASAGPAAAGIGLAVAAALAFVEAGRRSEDQAVALGRALEVGGGQAGAAQAYVDKFAMANDFLGTKIGGAVGELGLFGYTVSDLVPDLEQSRDAYEKWYSKLGPGAQATEDVAVATSKLSEMVEKYGATSPQAARASGELAAAQAEVTRIAEQESLAIRGVTEAMIDQINQSRAAVDAQFALELAGEGVEDALARQAELMKSGTASADELEDAARAVAMAYRDYGQAASDAATTDLPASMDEQQKAIVGAKAELEYYNGLLASGVDLPQSLDDHVAYLQNVVSGADMAAIEAAILKAKAEEAGVAVDDLGKKEANPKITGDASIFAGVHTNTLSKMEQLEQKYATPKVLGDASVFAGVHTNTMSKIAQLAAQTPTPKAQLDANPFAGAHAAAMGKIGQLAGQRPTPVASLADSSFKGIAANVQATMLYLARLSASPTATLIANTKGAEAALNYAARNRTSYVTQVVTKADGGPIAPIFAATGRKVAGAGGPRDDLVPAIGPGGVDYRLSAGEWIVNAMASGKYGDAGMRSINAGTALVIPDATSPRRSSSSYATAAMSEPALGSGSAAGGGNSVIVQRLDVHLQGFDIRDRAEIRRFAKALRDEIVRIEMAEH